MSGSSSEAVEDGEGGNAALMAWNEGSLTVVSGSAVDWREEVEAIGG